MKRQVFSAIFFIIVALGIVLFSFTFFEVQREEAELTDDLERRSLLVAESLRESIEPYIISENSYQLQSLVNRFSDRERLMGLLVYDNKDSILASSSTIPTAIPELKKAATYSMDQDRPYSEFVRIPEEEGRLYTFALPLHNQGSVIGSLMVVHNATYIDLAVAEIWENGVLRFLLYSILIAIAVYLIIHWVLSRPMHQLIESIRGMRIGNTELTHGDVSRHTFFHPIINEISSIQKNLIEAQHAASYEARLRLEEQDSPWTAERLREFTKDVLRDRALYIVSNREPYIHKKNGNSISVVEPASGMVTALDPIMKACGGVWVAHGSGSADKEVVDNDDKVRVPPSDPKYALKRVWLTEEDEKGYYYGFSNDGLWPLCHAAFVEPHFRKTDFEAYKTVNGKFAKSILHEIKDISKPLIFIQDYHFTLLPQILKKSRPDAVIAMFWHIPWPSPESFRICPWREEILEGMLGADLLAFHTQLHCNNFIDTVKKELEALVDLEQFSIQKNGHHSYIKPFPISVAFQDTKEGEKTDMSIEERNKILQDIGVRPTEYIGIGVDRMDYTKGIIERVFALERFFEKYPTFIRKFTFIQIAPSTRQEIPSYKHFYEEVQREIERVNKRFKEKNWLPIVLINKHQNRETLRKMYKITNICLVTSLHDGMNLVAKEFIAERSDEKGVLILSQFAGASRELSEALLINPYDTEVTADTIKTALEMMISEQTKRMRLLRKTIRNNNIYRWAVEIIKAMVRIES